MAIDAYYGKPRNGKSYSVVANVVVPALNSGRNVYTNIPMNGDYANMDNLHTFKNDCGVMFFTTIEAGAVIVIDEAWRFFPAGERATSIHDDVKEFLAMHGHNVDAEGNTTQIVIISQTPSQIGTFIKGLIQNAYKVSKKGEKRFRTDHYQGDNAEKLTGEPDAQFFTVFKPETFAAYKTSTNSATGQVGNERRIDGRGGIMSNWSIKWGLPIALVLLTFGGYQAYKALTKVNTPEEKPVTPKMINKPTISKIADDDSNDEPEPEEPATPLSTDLRVQGWSQYKKGDPITVYIKHTSGRIYPIDSSECVAYFDTYACMIMGSMVTPTTGTPDHVYNVQALAEPISTPF